jgi:argininosuccinate lyase
MKIEKLWGARLEKETSPRILEFLSGRDVRGLPPCDEILIPYDIWGSKVHTIMLWKQGIISDKDAREILEGLKGIEARHHRGEFRLNAELEDVHSNVESDLIERFGVESAGKIHTARSRNDQIALDMRLYLRDQAVRFVGDLIALIKAIAALARKNVRTVMPGFTHYQHAMITTFGHMLMGLAMPLERDLLRFVNWYGLFNRNPLGGAAGYGTAFPVDRDLTSRLLAFDGPEENSTDPVTNRWEPETELAFAVTMTMNHLSTMAQTLILMSTTAFGMLRLDDAHSDGSSMMPQKRNPGPLEVIKAKASIAQGILTGLMSIGKGAMVGYNRDSQWTKYLIMDMVSECAPALPVMKEIVEGMAVNASAMEAQARKGFIASTHLLESILKHAKLPFRQGKGLVERAVRFAEKAGREAVSLTDLNRAVRETGLKLRFASSDIARWQNPAKILEGERAVGGPGLRATQKSISGLTKRLREHVKGSKNQSLRIRGAIKEIESIERHLGVP